MLSTELETGEAAGAEGLPHLPLFSGFLTSEALCEA